MRSFLATLQVSTVFVHLLATQWGDEFPSVPDLTWGSQGDPGGRHFVTVGTENRQNMLGHLGLLGARNPVMPMVSGGAPEGRIGAPIAEEFIFRGFVFRGWSATFLGSNSVGMSGTPSG